MTRIWLSTDEASDVAGSIRHAVRTSSFVHDDPQAWKWLFLALHSALQGACIAHLTTTSAPIGALEKQNTVEWLEYNESGRFDPNRSPPKTKLLALPELLKTIRKPNSAGNGSIETGVMLSDQEYQWLKRMHDDVRNQFVHFEAMGWSLDVSGIPALAKLISRIITDILEIGWAFRYLDEEEYVELKTNLAALSTWDWKSRNGATPSND